MKVLGGIVLGLLLVALGAGLFLWTGAYNVAASSPPGKMETRLATFALNKSIQKRAPATKNPLSASPDVLRAGLSHYRENCVVCHGALGVDASEFGEGLNPPAPDLTLPRVQERPDGEMFWIVSNGIRMTGMPAFSPTHKEGEIWKIVAFLRHLPELTPEEQRELKARTEEEHHHEEAGGGMPSEGNKPEAPAAGGKATHTHPPGTKPHKD